MHDLLYWLKLWNRQSYMTDYIFVSVYTWNLTCFDALQTFFKTSLTCLTPFSNPPLPFPLSSKRWWALRQVHRADSARSFICVIIQKYSPLELQTCLRLSRWASFVITSIIFYNLESFLWNVLSVNLVMFWNILSLANSNWTMFKLFSNQKNIAINPFIIRHRLLSPDFIFLLKVLPCFHINYFLLVI